MLRWIRLTALVAAVETQASPVKPASGWSAPGMALVTARRLQLRRVRASLSDRRRAAR